MRAVGGRPNQRCCEASAANYILRCNRFVLVLVHVQCAPWVGARLRPTAPDAGALGSEPVGDFQRKTQAPLVWCVRG